MSQQYNYGDNIFWIQWQTAVMFMRLDSVQLNAPLKTQSYYLPLVWSIVITIVVTLFQTAWRQHFSELLIILPGQSQISLNFCLLRWGEVRFMLFCWWTVVINSYHDIPFSSVGVPWKITWQQSLSLSLWNLSVHMIAFALTCLILASVLGLKCLSNLITKKYLMQIIWFEAMFNMFI